MGGSISAGTDGLGGIGGVCSRDGERNEERSEKALQGWQDEVVPATESFAMKGERGAEDSAKAEKEETILLGSV